MHDSLPYSGSDDHLSEDNCPLRQQKVSERSFKMDRRFSSFIGFTLIAAMLTGIASVVVAVFAFFNSDWIASGICLTAAALAFGLTTNALLRR
jgi:hypothetical protein